LKKPAGSVRFRFYKTKTEKIESNPNRKKLKKNRVKLAKNRTKAKKPSQTGKNQAKTEPNRKNRAKPV